MDGSLFFSVGEPSGDLHAANLISQLQTISAATNSRNHSGSATDLPSAALTVPSPAGLTAALQFRGLGGTQMAAVGCEIDYDLTQLAVVGIMEVLPKLREFFRVADLAEAVLEQTRPRAVVLVDFPGFNWHIARRAKRLGIPVIYYLPPQLWAWGAWRLRKMRQTVDHVLCNLPFEPEWYARRNMQVDYVGHPFFDEVHERALDTSFIQRWKPYDGVQVAVLPGSRSREVQKIWPMQLAAIRHLSARYPKTRFLVAAYRDNHAMQCRQLLNSSDQQRNIEFFVGKTSEIIDLCDCALMKSGSVSLEFMARARPAVVTYHASRSLYLAGRLLTNLNSMTLPNMIAGETVMPEYLAVGSTAKATAQVIAALDRLIGDADARALQAQKLRVLADRYAQPGASRRAAMSIAKFIGMQVPATPESSATSSASLPSAETTSSTSRHSA